MVAYGGVDRSSKDVKIETRPDVSFTQKPVPHTDTHTKKKGGKNDLLLRRSRSNSTKIYAHSHCYYYEPTGRRKIIKKKNMRSVSKWKRIKQNGTQKGSTKLLVKVKIFFYKVYII
jgi:hypothetical protein